MSTKAKKAPEQEEVKEEEKQEKQESQDPKVELPRLLKSFDHSPSEGEIESWKATHGEVFVSGFSETDIFVWRAVTRLEYRQVQEKAQDPQQPLDQFAIEELVCDMCVLWNSDVSGGHLTKKAGTASTLFEQIMQNSNFLTPQAASMLVVKL